MSEEDRVEGGGIMGDTECRGEQEELEREILTLTD